MRNRQIAFVLNAVLETPWAILESKLIQIENFLSERIDVNISEDDLKASVQARIVGSADAPKAQQIGSVAVIPIFGTISHRMNMFAEISGGTSTEMLQAQLIKAIQDEAVSSILLDVNSPGGTVAGLTELHAVIMGARSSKPIVASVNALAASAAYWIASAASEITITPSGQAGSIGVYLVHEDRSEMAKTLGIKFTHVSAGKFKTEANPVEPLTDEAKAALQNTVDKYYNMFVKDVAEGRGVSVSDVRNGYGEGRVLTAQDAKAAGMVDRVETIDATIARLAKKNGSKTGMRSETFGRQLAMREKFLR